MSINHSLSHKIVSLTELTPLVNHWKSEGKKIVFTNGCFDLLHAGHITYLTEAASLGDILIIGLNSDDSVSRIKGPFKTCQQ
ncbi:adenylyltransferase/cytidyltransferase family protein [Pedobacter sp. NJ-S-72]